MSHRQKIIFLFVFLLCFFSQILPVIRDGLLYSYGYGFWGPSGHDGVWHLSLINHINNPFRIAMPNFSGEYLKNYHPFFDILLSLIHRFTGISPSLLLFQLFPIISTVLLLWLSFLIGRKFSSKFFGGILFMFFNSFANSLGWLVSLIRIGKISGESMFWSMQSFSNQLNPPYVLSLIFLLTLIYLLLKKHFSFLNFLLIFVILVLSPVTKIYSVICIFPLYFFYSLYQLSRHHPKHIITFFLGTFFALLFFLQYNQLNTSQLILKPFWLIQGMFDSTDRLFWPRLASAIFNLSALPTFNLKLALIYLLGSFVFIVGNYSFRLLGFIHLEKFKSNILRLILIVPVIISVLIPILFSQNGTAWNIIQFFYYGLLISNLFLADYLSHLSVKQSILITLPVVLFTFISNIESYQNYLGNPSPAALPPSEIQALNFLNTQPSGIVLSPPYNDYLKQNLSTPVPLYAYETSAYIPAFSRQTSFVEDEMNLLNSGYNWQIRHQQSEEFFKATPREIFKDRGFLLTNDINYIYIAGIPKKSINLDISNLFLTKIFENDNTVIYRVQR